MITFDKNNFDKKNQIKISIEPVSNKVKYNIIARSPDKPELMQSNTIRKDVLFPGNYKVYTIDINDTKKPGVIYISPPSSDLMVKFKAISSLNSQKENSKWINENIYTNNTISNPEEYAISFSFYSGVYQVGKEIFNSCDISCTLLVLVDYTRSFSLIEIDYSISYVNDKVNLPLNKPYSGYALKSQFNFFTFTVPKEAKNLYVSLTDMSSDADIYLNYGEEYPIRGNSTWSSTTMYSELIDIDITDKYYTANNLNDMSGVYTIGIYGFYNTTYTLYVSTEDKKLIPWNYGDRVTCRTKNDEEYCYFKYSNQYVMKTTYYFIVDYLFGSGIIYAKYYKDTPYDIYSILPDKNNFDISSKDQDSRDVLYMHCKITK